MMVLVSEIQRRVNKPTITIFVISPKIACIATLNDVTWKTSQRNLAYSLYVWQDLEEPFT